MAPGNSSTYIVCCPLDDLGIDIDIDIGIGIDIDIDIALKQLSQQTLNQRRKEARIQIDKTWQKISLFIVVALT